MIRKAVIVVLTLAAVGTGALWIRSRSQLYYPEHIFRHKDLGTLSTQIIGGTIGFVWLFANATPMSCTGPPTVLGFLGAYYVIRPAKLNSRGCCVAVYELDFPLWLLFTLLAAYPTIAFIRGPLRRWRRHKRGECVDCGYNLTGNVTGVCSECGTKLGHC